MRISRCGLPPTKEEVRRMIETYLLSVIYILFWTLTLETIITFALIIALVIIISKQK